MDRWRSSGLNWYRRPSYVRLDTSITAATEWSPHRARTAAALKRVYGPLSRESMVPSFTAAGAPSVSGILAWGVKPGPFMSQCFARQDREAFPKRKNLIQKWFMLSRPKRDFLTQAHDP